jgi:hypothetical protein
MLNAILCEDEPYTIWQPLYLTAIRTYRPALLEKHAQRIDAWRQQIKQNLEAEKNKYRNDGRYNKLVSLLFPEITALLLNPLPRNGSATKPIDTQPVQVDPLHSEINNPHLNQDRI